MFVHLETERFDLHMNVDMCIIDHSDLVEINVYGFINILVFLEKVQYLSCYDKGKCTLLVKDGEILKEEII